MSRGQAYASYIGDDFPEIRFQVGLVYSRLWEDSRALKGPRDTYPQLWCVRYRVPLSGETVGRRRFVDPRALEEL